MLVGVEEVLLLDNLRVDHRDDDEVTSHEMDEWDHDMYVEVPAVWDSVLVEDVLEELEAPQFYEGDLSAQNYSVAVAGR